MSVRSVESHVLVQVAANERQVREAVCTAVLGVQQFCVSGVGRLRDALQACRIGGANLIVAVGEHVDRTILETDGPPVTEERKNVHVESLCMNPPWRKPMPRREMLVG